MFEETTATGLGIASIGIGLTEIAAPQKLQEIMGIGNGENTGIMRVLGVREICHGIDILTHKDPTPGIWARVAGDMLDGVLLGVAASKTRRPGGFAAIAAAVLPVVVADVVTCMKLTFKRD
jgi:hypothetical protein